MSTPYCKIHVKVGMYQVNLPFEKLILLDWELKWELDVKEGWGMHIAQGQCQPLSKALSPLSCQSGTNLVKTNTIRSFQVDGEETQTCS